MRSISITKSGINKIKGHQLELKSLDLDESIKSIPPGEWCLITVYPETWVAFVNSQIDDKYPCTQVVGKLTPEQVNNFDPAVLIQEKISTAAAKRLRWDGYDKGSRIFYGNKDGLPGLIVDEYSNAIIVQINTAGIDRYREHIKKIYLELKGKPVYYLDNAKYRQKEFLPTYQAEAIPELHVEENGIKYKLRSEVIQKVGFYYDHRENRLQLMGLLRRLKLKPQRGIDLFCYAGAWGLSALSSGVPRVDFVDQGDFEAEVESALALNGFSGQGKFHRTDVFKFLEAAVAAKASYDVILCDPPAFAKSSLQKPQALEGYSKLHRRVMKVAAPGALCAFSSCTHYVTDQDFQKNILDAATKEHRKVQLVYSGLQGFDHPVESLDDRSNYIKSYFYLLE
ncbi:MAG TPA: class I SAM-dependent methyltransferase [Bacteriovoracaceae bacterium]|nr:class I SAM-dependent methyltransferase [Bacteriovoracaceae bacterium]